MNTPSKWDKLNNWDKISEILYLHRPTPYGGGASGSYGSSQPTAFTEKQRIRIEKQQKEEAANYKKLEAELIALSDSKINERHDREVVKPKLIDKIMQLRLSQLQSDPPDYFIRGIREELESMDMKSLRELLDAKTPGQVSNQEEEAGKAEIEKILTDESIAIPQEVTEFEYDATIGIMENRVKAIAVYLEMRSLPPNWVPTKTQEQVWSDIGGYGFTDEKAYDLFSPLGRKTIRETFAATGINFKSGRPTKGQN